MNCPECTYPLEDATLSCTSTDYRVTNSINMFYIILEQSNEGEEVGDSRTIKWCDCCKYWEEVT